MHIVSQSPWWYYLLCLLLGAAYAFFLYRKDRKLSEFPSWLIYLLGSLRFVLSTALAVLLLAPLLTYFSRTIEEPIVVIAEDRTASLMATADSSYMLGDFREALSAIKDKLQGDYQTDHLWFGETVRQAEDSGSYTDRLTNYESLFENLADRYENRNVGAVILATDGIYNQGSNPLYVQDAGRFPVYTIPVGNTEIRKDVKINRLIHNEIAFLGNEFPLQMEIQATKAAGETVKVEVLYGGQVKFSENIAISSDNQLIELKTQLNAERVGIQAYKVKVSSLENEENLANNVREFYIDVIDSRQKILLLYATPHPDVNAIRQSLQNSENYELTVADFEKFKGEIKDFSLLILHQVPAPKSLWAKEFLDKVRQQKLATFCIATAFTDWNLFNAQPYPLTLIPNGQATNEVQPQINERFTLFTLTEKEQKAIRNFSPLFVPLGNFRNKGENHVLFKQQIGAVETEYPMLAFSDREGFKSGALIGDGLWRWRLQNFAELNNHQVFDGLINKIVQYLAVKADKSFIRLKHEKKFLENETVRLDLQLFNQSYEAVNEPEVEISLKDAEGNEYNYVFSRNEQAYFLEIEGLPSGNYSYRASSSMDGRQLVKQGEFAVEELQLEKVNTVADHNLLFQLSKQSGGRMISRDSLKYLPEILKQNNQLSSIAYTHEKVEDIINLKWIFYILLGLLSLEWFLRKYHGAY